jgi:predicted signal transduction protein with EAL and GGDEF domain
MSKGFKVFSVLVTVSWFIVFGNQYAKTGTITLFEPFWLSIGFYISSGWVLIGAWLYYHPKLRS